MLGVEGEDGHIDLFHDFSQEGCCFERSKALRVQRIGEFVNLSDQFLKSVVGSQRPALSAANGKVTFTKRSDQVGNSLQWEHDVTPKDQREDDPRGDGD